MNARLSRHLGTSESRNKEKPIVQQNSECDNCIKWAKLCNAKDKALNMRCVDYKEGDKDNDVE